MRETPFRGKMFDDQDEKEKRFGDYKEKVNFSKYDHLREVEAYFSEQMLKYPTYPAYDINGGEKPYFDTLVYTTFSDFFIMHPLQPDLKHMQIIDSLIYHITDTKDVNVFEIYGNALTNSNVNRYKTSSVSSKKIEAVVVLPGNNKFGELCFNKLKLIYDNHGQLVVFKPHPLTENDSIDHLNKALPVNAIVADKEDDLYDYIKSADIVYGNHSSESIFHALCMGKKVDTITNFQSRWFTSYGHINCHLLDTDTPMLTINKIFNDYRSGIVNPKIHSDWKEKISMYLEYIHKKRLKYKYAYV